MSQDGLLARLRATFAAELGDQVRLMNADLLALEAEPTDAARLKSLFRVAHTLKGAARTADVPLVEEVCHDLESLLVEARDGTRRLEAEDFQLFFAAADALAEAGDRLKASASVETPALSYVLQRLRTGRVSPRARVESSPPRPPHFAPRAPAGPTPEPVPAVPPRPDVRDDVLRVDPARLDALLASSSQLLMASGRLSDRPAELDALHESAKELLAKWRRARSRVRHGSNGNAKSWAEVVTWVEAQITTLAQQSRRLAADAVEDARSVGQVTDRMLDEIRRLRVRPFSEACEALPRAARDLAAAAGKEITLEIADGGVEADRAVLDGLREALLQLLRNAVDHGIELPAVRERLGKPRRGRIRVTAELRGERLRVAVADDGSGLDEASIRARLAVRGQADPATRHDLVRVLLEGGTSTRAEADAISGRGVGLDIVRSAVERIHGRVEVDWAEGRGTTFTLTCPPSPSSTRALLVTVGGQVVAIPMADIAAAAATPVGAIRRAAGRDTVPTAEGPVPMVSLATMLGHPAAAVPANGRLPMIVVRSGDRRVALVVDALLTERDIVLRPIPGREGRFPLLNGAAILATGQVALVLDAVSAIDRAATVAATVAPVVPSPVEPQTQRTRLRVLVVEDSITTRTLEQSILEAAGYAVATAVDGAEGLAWLQEHPCDLVVADVDMPRMDGLSLCQAVRASPHLKRVPFILVTARESAEDRARGLEVGADAYLGKSSFDQQGLLDTVRQLIG